VLSREAAVGDLLLDDIAQVQDVAAGPLPKPLSGIRIHRSAQGRREQRAALVGREWLQVEAVEAAHGPRTDWIGSAVPDCAQAANAPKGSSRADDELTVHRAS
jgi:hypothetical protein